MYVFSVRDNVSNLFSFGLSKFVNKEVAIRAFKDLITRDGQFSLHVEDFDLYLVGEFFEESGKFVSSADLPLLVFRGADLRVDSVQE